ncbi:MAG: hypothetical protein P9L99_00065 [Candidatus Lernaella stagnicola]|nr:hypothetical protein [Candidatus Lernaella stagnicola]
MKYKMEILKTALRLSVLILLVGLAFFGCGNGNDDDDDDSDAAPPAGDDDDNDDDNDNDDDDTVEPSAELTLPPFPYWPNDVILPDVDHMETLATDYCRHATSPTANEFFFGQLPMQAFDLCFEPTPPPELETLMGDLFVSGYFGGVWLNEALGLGLTVPPVPEYPFAHLRPVFDALTSFVGPQLEMVEGGSDDEVLDTAQQHIRAILMIYAYNLGYVKQILRHPPPGAADYSEWLTCAEDQLLACEGTMMDLDFLHRYDAALDSLRDPPDSRWELMASWSRSAERFVASGEFVWRMIDISGLSPEDYELLVELSLNFLFASRSSVLGNMSTWADEDAAEGRYSLRIDAGMILWAGSYFMGLAGGTDELPELVCPE